MLLSTRSVISQGLNMEYFIGEYCIINQKSGYTVCLKPGHPTLSFKLL